jgi:hypothetical protein
MADDTLDWLQKWFGSNCLGDWRSTGSARVPDIEITAIYNPGWSIKIALKDTDAEGLSFDEVRVERSETDWLVCSIYEWEDAGGRRWEASCGPENLAETLALFRAWVSATPS